MIYFQVIQTIYLLLNKREKLLSLFLLFLITFTILLETFGLATFFPLISAVVDENYFNNPVFIKLSSFFGIKKIDLNIFFIFFLGLFIFKNIYLVFFTYWQNYFTNKISLRIGHDLYSSYLNKKYSFHLKANSAILLRNIQQTGSIDSTFLRILTLINEFFLILGIFFLLVFVNPKATFIISFLIIFLLFIYNFFTKNKVKYLGQKAFDMSGFYSKNLLQGIHAYKEIILFNKRNFFIEKNFTYRKKLLDVSLFFNIISFLPRALIEIICVLSILILINLLTQNDNSIKETIPTLAIFAAAAFRLFPSFLKIFGSMQNFIYVKPVVENIKDEMINIFNDKDLEENSDINKNGELIFEKEIEVKNIEFHYLNNSPLIINFNFKIKKSNTIGIIGKSGSGKTTFLNMLTGLLNPTKGKILVDGVDINNNKMEWREKIGYVSQSIFLLDLTIAENIAFGVKKEQIDYQRVNKCIQLAGLTDYVEELKEGYNNLIGEQGVRISGGQRQRLGLARALYKNPDILILDEATNSLDINTENKILNTLKNLKNKFTILIVSHHENPLQIVDEVYELKSNNLTKIKK